MHRRSRGARLGAVALLACLCASSALALDDGDRAPSFTVPNLAGGDHLSLDAYRGKVVYLDFWASWCTPCLASLPAIEDLRREFPAEEFQVLAINVDSNPKKARKFLGKHPVGYPSATDPRGRLPESFGLETMPTSYLIDRKGVIRYVHPGFQKQDVSEIRSRIERLVEQK